MKVFKWDDDLAVVLPQELVDRLGLEEGAELEIVSTPRRAAENDQSIQETTEQGELRHHDR